ncbi:MAG: Type secretion system protein, partial [Pseudomonadota bacterium]
WIESIPPGATLSGDSQTLSFTTLIDEPPLDMARLSDVQLALSDTTLRAVAGPTDEPALIATLSSTATGLTIRYYGSPMPNGQSGWHDTWPATAVALPDLIRIDYPSDLTPAPPLSVIPALSSRQSEISLSSPEPPG